MSAGSEIRTRLLTPEDASAYADLRLRMLRDEPWAFVGTEDNDGFLDVAVAAQRLGERENDIVAAEDPVTPGRLIASAGVRREPWAKLRHRALIWGVFVEASFRGRGLGSRVVTEALEVARSWAGVEAATLSVSERTPGAQRMYERLGFEAWGREPDAVRWSGGSASEIHMRRAL